MPFRNQSSLTWRLEQRSLTHTPLLDKFLDVLREIQGDQFLGQRPREPVLVAEQILVVDLGFHGSPRSGAQSHELPPPSSGKASKANHLTYIGDAEVGERVNVGAGTITCNYDGAAKHKTVIEDECFIGSDATLVAPVRIARGSYIGAGSTINKDTPAGQLTVARARQVSIPDWKPPKKTKS